MSGVPMGNWWSRVARVFFNDDVKRHRKSTSNRSSDFFFKENFLSFFLSFFIFRFYIDLFRQNATILLVQCVSSEENNVESSFELFSMTKTVREILEKDIPSLVEASFKMRPRDA